LNPVYVLFLFFSDIQFQSFWIAAGSILLLSPQNAFPPFRELCSSFLFPPSGSPYLMVFKSRAAFPPRQFQFHNLLYFSVLFKTFFSSRFSPSPNAD